jgi:hypothetical protein
VPTRSRASVLFAQSKKGQQCRYCSATINRKTFNYRCSACDHRLKRHGAENATGLLRREIDPYAEAAYQVRERNLYRVDWAALRAEYEAVVKRCRSFEKECQRGNPYQKHERYACNVMVQIAENVPYERGLDLVAALWMFQLLRPSRFRGSDQVFAFAVGNVLRKEGRADRRFRVGSPRSRTLNPERVEYRELNRETRHTLYRLINAAFGRAAVHIAKLEVDRATEETRRKDAVTAALASIT